MAEFVGSQASFWVQSNALLRKNLTFQKRRMCANITLILIPAFFCILCALIQYLTDIYAVRNGPEKCGFQEFHLQCPIPSPVEFPPLLQVPPTEHRAVRSDLFPWTDLPDSKEEPRPVTILITGNDQTIAQSLGLNMLPVGSIPDKSTSNVTDFSKFVMGTDHDPPRTLYQDSSFSSSNGIKNLQLECNNIDKEEDSTKDEDEDSAIYNCESFVLKHVDVYCLPCLILWRNSSTEINDELFKGDAKGNKENKINEILTAFDISNSDTNTFNVTIWYNSNTNKELRRVPRLVNMASNAYLWFLKGNSRTQIMFDFNKEMPKGLTTGIPPVDVGALIGPLLFTWIILQLFPVVLASLVYEKQERLRVMMKMHGLGDGPYWMISYSYFLTISMCYIIFFVGFGSILGLTFFYKHDYSLQFTFYFLVINLQIALAFLMSAMFSTTMSATVVAYIYVFGSGLLGVAFLQTLIDDIYMDKAWIITLELFPGFSLYRGLVEFMNYATEGKFMNTRGMQWDDLNDSVNGMKDVLIIMALESAVLLLLAFYIDQVVTWGKSPLVFLRRKKAPTLGIPSIQRHGSKGFGDMEKPDVAHEKEKVDKLMEEAKYTSHVVICDNIKKVYPGRDGNPEKFAVRGLSLALPQGECFGMLGPSGAGKTSFIEMLIGLQKPTAGTAYVQGLDLVTQMHEIYSCIGVCPQHNLLWATLTGREHLLFYGRLKNLKGSHLTRGVEDSLKNLNLFNGGVADKRAGQYSGGMKRRLSVAISLIGNPIAVYLDEPSTGLDPASRNTLWNVIKLAKQGRVIILTTHSMEEAEFLCDRIGIFVDGRMQCIGNPKELKGRYGGSYVFTITTDSCYDQEVETLIQRLAPNATRVYHLAGTQKFEFAKSEVRIADVFQTVEHAKKIFTVYAWGLSDTTLEDVFIKVASAPKFASNVLSRDNLVE
ncbi:ABC transporter A family member 10-like [Argentina anserina]|uniref:ABC transporter A family member 10-like n=1 Tax=Argentina anserina TaxID=57926 RepID=UPI0021762D67|nr:ABC transporter A family member 10-like [Potentilla anserina]